jgi:putative tributyrin esterase
MSLFRTLEISDPRFEHDGLRSVTAKSAALGGRADLTVWAPAEAPPRGLVILLHGVYGSHWAWARKGGAHRTAGRMIADGVVPPLALAMPSDGLWGDGSGYLRHPRGDFERWIVEEVPAATREAVPGLAGTAPVFVAGLSMGGFGALRLGAKYPRRFAAVSGHSSITEFEQLARFVEEPLAAYACAAADRSVLATLVRNRDLLPPLRFDCGLDDPLLAENRALHQALRREGIAHEYEEFPGGHEWPYWEAHLADSLRFFARTAASFNGSDPGLGPATPSPNPPARGPS